ncbi:MAG TPA: ATPase, T2SS/T4P/T4SS family [Patescibacteria group bacterium]|nr:ATPase, T2SS/T4P/T4SS family [Patescibacteria group bacterium]
MGTKNALMGRFLSNADKFNSKQIAETLSMLVKYGLERGASDIHIEPHERFVLVRYRIDGTLRGMHKLPLQALATVMGQIKKMAGLHVQETALPQEGIYETTVNGQKISIRVSTMPVYGGEKAVLHLVVHPGKPQELETLGFWGEGLKTVQSVLTTPHGLVLVSGPKHSGISSTLFGLLDQLTSPMVSIATVETGTKHRLPGINQTYTAANNMTVQEGMQAALKQDANIIMANDMPDSATAELAIHAATAGHLMLMGMHADNAIAAALRMRVAGIEPFMLVTSLRTSIGQRLVRRLCPDCRERYAISPEENRMIRQTFGITTTATLKRVYELEHLAANSGLGQSGQFNTALTQITHLWRPSAEGCTKCNHTGYQNRTAIIEVLAITEAVQKSLMDRNTISVAAVQKVALQGGFVPMALDGLIKALCGYTTVNEVLRAVSAPPLA